MTRLVQSLLVALGCGLLMAYFGYHVAFGPYGLEAQARTLDRLVLVERRLATLETVRHTLRRDISLLTSEPPDRDLVEEIAGATLGFAYPGDTILVPAQR